MGSIAMKQIIFICTLLTTPGFVLADDEVRDCCCDHCGCQSHCQKVCHVICEMKEVKTTCFCCKDVDICLPGHSKKCGDICEPNPCCEARPVDCDCNCNANEHHGFLDCLFGPHTMIHRTEWQPGCAAGMRTVTKLIKYEVTKKVPTYTWKVEYCCDGCRTKMALEDADGGASAMAGLSPRDQATAGRAIPPPGFSQPKLGGVEQASYQSDDAAPRHALPWDKMFK
jgi:hypothetical protein